MTVAGGVVLLGLGPGEARLLTHEAWEWLRSIQELYVRTDQHPVVQELPAGVQVHSFDWLYRQGQSFDAVYTAIVEKVIELAHRPQGVTYAVPGHPLVAEATGPEILRRAQAEGLPIRVIEGLSFLEPTFTALGLDPFPRLVLLDALELGTWHVPSFPPDAPVLIAQIYDRMSASEVKLTLNAFYPDEHPVTLVHAAGTKQQQIEHLRLYEIDRSPHLGLMSALYVPPLGEATSMEAFLEIVAHLRAPDGCPWDRQQTHKSLRSHLLEEAYEVLAAIDADDPQALQEELGDLLLQVALHAQIASEEGEFNFTDVVRGIHHKIVRRHPHVFGTLKVEGVEGVLRNWERLKQAEREANGQEERSLLAGVPLALPALTQAQELQDRAARVGFDWPEIAPVWEKVREELQEVLTAPDERAREKELGDLLFAVVNLARWYKVDAESALRATNQRFRQRFAHIEQRAREMGRVLGEMTLAEMDALWEEAKHNEKGVEPEE
ncbi:nucleoside triphosphate pyrophosphohydrolase [Thermanaerothrix sp. 4228-RoL]|uniref:Nucleoside triphosphate pyrophosphohydrolase n=2 Tax=Thermanaerothrix TaxID=1077886 RepID=A0ABU3NLJ2_9CHLR|nr:nucleoside triphosphate pyrophosphohydrolase [Thermanaerothrix sp. 4228-RoL]MDT8897697.1 nucleoside triphosphate pyrophosphohydrolase [Thermanaerothrix sp. 4228-RoL]